MLTQNICVNCVRFIDAAEEETTMIAMFLKDLEFARKGIGSTD